MTVENAAYDPILQVEHLSMKFGGLVAIGDLSFQARRGEITALIGPNGAGKTTVFNCITGFYKPTEGMIRLNRKSGQQFLLERLPNHEIPARAKVARTFQNIRLFSGMTLLENLLVAQHNKLMKASGYTVLGLLGLGSYKKAAAESVELAKYWLEKTDLVDRADDPAGDLPYGAQRRLEIARAMCTGPELLCLDEPAAGLNPKESQALNNLLINIKESTGTSILLIEHDMSVVMQISDHVVVLEYGRKISDGSPEAVRNDPRVIAAYLGVDDDEVTDVLTEVGDEQVIEQLEGMPDPAHGSGASASMMVGSITDTIGHSDDRGERVTVAVGASKSEQVDAAAVHSIADAKNAAPSKASPTLKAASAAKAKAKASKAAPKKDEKPASKTASATAKPAEVASVGTAPAAKPAAGAAKTPASTKASAARAATAANVLATPVAAKLAPAVAPVAKSSAVKSSAAKPSAVDSTTVAAPAAMSVTKPSTSKAATAKAPAAKAPAAKAASASKTVAPAQEAAASTKAAAPAKPAPAKAVTAKAAADPAAGPPDRLILIKGIGPVNERKLNEHGIFRFAQIAAWKKSDIIAVEAYLAFDGRIAREDWIGQAKALAKAAANPAQTKRGVAK